LVQNRDRTGASHGALLDRYTFSSRNVFLLSSKFGSQINQHYELPSSPLHTRSAKIR